MTFARRFPLVAAALALTIPVARAEDRKLPTPARLSQAARRTIRQRMDQHGRQMSELVWAVLLIDFAGTERAAKAIAEAPRALDRAAPELADQFDLTFFELQDELRQRARTLADAALERDVPKMNVAYQSVAGTCVNCHYLYLTPTPPQRK